MYFRRGPCRAHGQSSLTSAQERRDDPVSRDLVIRKTNDFEHQPEGGIAPARDDIRQTRPADAELSRELAAGDFVLGEVGLDFHREGCNPWGYYTQDKL